MATATARPENWRSLAAKKAWDTIRANAGKPKPAPKPRPKLEALPPIKLPKEVKQVSSKDMMLKTVVLSVTIHRIGNSRKVDPDTVNIVDVRSRKDLNKDYFGVDKKLMEAPELKVINSKMNSARSYIMGRALPFQIKVGVYLMPREFHEEVEAKLEEFNADVKPHVELLAKNLPQYKKEAKAQQGPQFIEEQWPTPDEIRKSFCISWRWLFVDSAEGLKKEIYEKERRKAEADWAETRETIKMLLRTQFADFVTHLTDKLKPEDGKTKIIKENSFDKLHEFLSTFSARNITNDVQLEILVNKAKHLATKMDTELLRTDDAVRDYVLHNFETIQVLLDPMIGNKPHRKIILED